MKAHVLYGVNDLRFEEVERPVPGQGEVLLRVEAVGICGSDIPRIYETGAHRHPLIPGHEFAGTICEAGEGAEEEFRKNSNLRNESINNDHDELKKYNEPKESVHEENHEFKESAHEENHESKESEYVGNHESTENDLKYSSVKVLEGKNRYIIDKPDTLNFPESKLELCFLPYITEVSRKPLNNYFPKTTNKRIIFSHNDLAGVQLGPVVSRTGFKLDEIDQNCDLFINGHLHNGTWVNKKVRNLGILTGQNFLENAELYPHNVMILDTDNMTYEDIENPYAFNFYKRNIDIEEDIKKLDTIKNNAALYLVYNEKLIDDLRNKLSKLKPKIAAERLVKALATVLTKDLDISNLQVDHLKLLVEFCSEKFGSNEYILYELQEICK